MTFTRTFRKGDVVCLDGDPSVRGFFLRHGQDGTTAVVEWRDCNRSASVDKARLRHAPVTVIGTPPAKPRETCPECGNPLSVDTVERFNPREGKRAKRTTVRAEFCGWCEYLREVKK